MNRTEMNRAGMNRAGQISATHRRALSAVLSGILVVLATASRSAAQAPASPPAGPAPPPAGSAPPPVPGGATGGAAPVAPVDVPSPGFRFGSSEVSVVGGNVASARERAVAEALKQAVDQAITELAPDARAAQPKVVGQILGKARVYVRRYRSILEGESRPSRYAVKLEAEVDEPAVRRTLERGAAAPAAAAAPGTPSYFVVGAGAVEASDAVVRALAGGGVRAERAPSGTPDQARAVEAAGRAGLGAVVFVNGAFTAEGQVRGAGVEAISCTVGLRVVAAPTGAAIAEDNQTARAFAPRADEARKDCFARAAAAAVPHVAPQAAASHGGASDLRTVIVDVEVSQAGAVQPLLKQLRGSGTISSVDLRRITPGRLELWVRSRLTAPGVVALLARDGGGPVALSGAEAAGDRVHVRASLREETPPAAVPPGAVLPGAAVPDGPGAANGPGPVGAAAKAEASP